jgi:hypothetical protein
MSEIRRLLHHSRGTPLADFLQEGLVTERVRALLAHITEPVSIHRDEAAHEALTRLRSHACCLNHQVFLGSAVGTDHGPSFWDTLQHELLHVAQVELSGRTGRVSTLDRIECEAAELAQDSSAGYQVHQGASPEQIYNFWWIIPLAAAAYVLLRPNVANAPEPGGKTYPSVSEAQVGGEALALFAVPEASFSVAGRLGLGFFGKLAVAGASSTMSFRAVGDVSSGEFSGVQTYVYDGATGAIIGVVVPGGIRLFGGGAFRSLDWLATQGVRQADLAITRDLAQRAASSPVTAEELEKLFQGRSLTGRAADWWIDRRGFIVLWRGQGTPTTSILSPLARTNGVAASEDLVASMRAGGLTDDEIAGYTAKWHTEPVPGPYTLPGFGGKPLGAAGIPTTRIPGIAANFPEGGVVYLIRLPRSAAIQVPHWGLSVENEWVVLNQIPRGSVISAVPATSIPALEVDASGRLVPGLRGAFGASVTPGTIRIPQLASPRLPLFGTPPLFTHPKKPESPPNPPGAGTVSEQTICIRPNSDYISPVCTTYKTYIVKNGDSLWALATKFYGDGKQHNKLYEANRSILGPHPNKPHLVPGQLLTVP